MKKLRPHQIKAMDMTRSAMGQGHKWVVVVMATGAGKTVLGSALVEAHLSKVKNGKILWVAHREELVSQAFDTLKAAGLSCGVIQANPTREVNPYRPVQVASIQTLTARNIKVDDATLVVYDECHHSMSEQWSEYALHYKRKGIFGVGLTATPIRADGLPLGDIFDEIVCPITMAELIDQGFLTPYELIRPKRILKKNQLAQSPVAAYQQHANPGEKAVVFASSVKNGENFRDEFLAAGIPAAVVSGTMDAGTRRKVLDDYASGAIKVICNVGVLTEGWDDPATSVVILARSIGSPGLFLQMVGRGLRTFTGKVRALILDLYGSSWKHGAPDEEREYTLDGDGIRKKNLPPAPEKFCQFCGCTIEADATVCTDCGMEKENQKPIEIINEALVKYARVRKQGTDQRAVNLLKWLRDCEANDHKPGRAYFKYEAVYGEKVPQDVRIAMQKLKSQERDAQERLHTTT